MQACLRRLPLRWRSTAFSILLLVDPDRRSWIRLVLGQNLAVFLLDFTLLSAPIAPAFGICSSSLFSRLLAFPVSAFPLAFKVPLAFVVPLRQ